MTLTDLVPSLALCQRLKAEGFPQDTALSWVEIEGGYQCDENGDPQQEMPPRADVVFADSQCHGTMLCAAPTAEEILGQLPDAYRVPWQGLCVRRGWEGEHLISLVTVMEVPPGVVSWGVGWSEDGDLHDEEFQPSLSLAAALAYLWWKEQK
jgi:hypothetical protein